MRKALRLVVGVTSWAAGVEGAVALGLGGGCWATGEGGGVEGVLVGGVSLLLALTARALSKRLENAAAPSSH